ncbi:hypothetical protein ACFQS7_08715 [Dankookia sp. GCM10030260]|uniref:hypothetical protein n=1 Tax=Dankookia sp. GCM10030260 TaxID=3273390 RepID=UPI003622476F
MREGNNGGRWVLLAAVLLGPPAWAQPSPQGTQQAAPAGRNAEVWDYRTHQPNPAEIEARERARGLPQAARPGETQEVDRLYRELTGSDPQAAPRATPRDTDRR